MANKFEDLVKDLSPEEQALINKKTQILLKKIERLERRKSIKKNKKSD